MTIHASIAHPLRVIDDLYSQGKNPDSDGDFGVTAYYSTLLEDKDHMSQVPILTSKNMERLGTGALVRVRGMVQDLLNHELYLGSYKDSAGVQRTTKYSGMLHHAADEALGQLPPSSLKLWERRPVYLVPIPGEADWYRQLQEDNNTEDQGMQFDTSGAVSGPKRGRETDQDDMDADVATGLEPAGGAAGPAGGKQPKLAEGAASSDVNAAPRDQGVGVVGCTAALAGSEAFEGHCLVYLDMSTAPGVRLHDVVDVVGVLCLDPGLAAAQDDGPGPEEECMEIMEEWRASQPPTSKVPRVHAIFCREDPAPSAVLAGPACTPDWPSARGATVAALAAALGGDSLAAEYCLLALLARVTARLDATSPVGAMPVNITGVQPGSPIAKDLHLALSALTPRCVALSVSREALEGGGWAPRRGGADGRTAAGALQMADGTVVLLDEGGVNTGPINARGVESLQALQTLIAEQAITCDFEYCKQQLPGSFPAIVLSSSRSLLRDFLPVVVPHRAGGSAPPLAPAAATDTGSSSSGGCVPVEALRAYLAAARAVEHCVGDEMSEFLGQQFVELRQRHPEIGPQEFHGLLTLARLCAASAGEARVSRSSWSRARHLDEQRRRRMAASTANPSAAAAI